MQGKKNACNGLKTLIASASNIAHFKKWNWKFLLNTRVYIWMRRKPIIRLFTFACFTKV